MTNWLCSSVFRLFMTRTMTASTRCFLSSSTLAGTSLPATTEGPSMVQSLFDMPPPASPERPSTRGTFTRKNLHSKAAFTWKISSSTGSLLFSFSPPVVLTKILAFGFTYKLMKCLLSSSTGMLVRRTTSCQVRLWWLLNNMRATIWYVETFNSCLDFPMIALTSADPWLGCQVSLRPVCLAR
eukprot:CAMPEP_0177242682 /NCGR_PEP_ID=MMETSP0367-20130122/48940_1 /TAXON_ID=447022 ORGANISM="Scrippsiella hangoei-like, Strain SHHI-4" /NCGR_SAMPLE_ID=MMETSP0367 /ASSEMBLY_ACC=CAM_ASM_000362 /LENGTH=182 /DNA_ID=CAMNT_0018694319 /DNA_START=233 /DNA_END=781 /DNA_ORIENTATION=+